jgi:iron complex transport system permease protein
MQYVAQTSSPGSARLRTRRERIAPRLLIGSAALLAVAVVLSISIGATGAAFDAVPKLLSALVSQASDPASAREELILLNIRLPRTILAMFVGASLAASGAMMQGLFRNPLADPAIIGVSAGAALGAVSIIALGHSFAGPWIALLGIYAVPAAAFVGGMGATLVLVAVAQRRGQLMVGTLLLAGLAVAAMAEAAMGFISYLSDDRALRDLTLWRLGSLAGASWAKVLGVIPFAIVVVVIIPYLVRGLNGLLFGEAEAFHLGIDVERIKRLVVVTTAASVGAAVAVAGIVVFVGIVVPHFVRLIAGPDHRIVLPASALLGAVLAVSGDIVARTLVAPAELPIGIVMAVIGGPVFLHLVLKRGVGGLEGR